MKPRLFIGSSSEGLDVSYAIQTTLEKDAEVTVWSQGIFEPHQYNLEALLAALPNFDAGVFVFTLDDLAVIRDKEQAVVRDNVILELGMFLGRLGLEHCYMVMPTSRGVWHFPTDLLGLHPLTFDPDRSDGRLEAALGPACYQIRMGLRKLDSTKDDMAETPKTTNLPGNAGLWLDSYRDFERLVATTLDGEITEHTAEALLAARVDTENRKFEKDPLPEFIPQLKKELDEMFTRMTQSVLSKKATSYTPDIIRVISTGRSNAFYTLDNPDGTPA